MRLLHKCERGTVQYEAAALALNEHFKKYGHYGISERTYTYRVRIKGEIVSIRIVNSTCSYVAHASNGARRLKRLWEENRA